MKDKKTIYEITIITAALMIGIVAAIHFIRMSRDKSREFITVGFVYDGDESTPFTANFIRAEKAVERDFGDRVRVIVKSNVSSGGGGERAISELVNEGCDLIFTTSIGYAEAAKNMRAFIRRSSSVRPRRRMPMMKTVIRSTRITIPLWARSIRGAIFPEWLRE